MFSYMKNVSAFIKTTEKIVKALWTAYETQPVNSRSDSLASHLISPSDFSFYNNLSSSYRVWCKKKKKVMTEQYFKYGKSY